MTVTLGSNKESGVLHPTSPTTQLLALRVHYLTLSQPPIPLAIKRERLCPRLATRYSMLLCRTIIRDANNAGCLVRPSDTDGNGLDWRRHEFLDGIYLKKGYSRRTRGASLRRWTENA